MTGRLHKCVMSEVKGKRPISGSVVCKPGHPALLPPDKAKLHYVVHYLHRGAFDRWVPEPETDEDKTKIEFYLCNACKKRFKNNLAKKEYPGRGSAICHIATDHGKLLDVMLADSQVETTDLIHYLTTVDPHMKRFFEKGTDLPCGDDIIKPIKITTFTLQQSGKTSPVKSSPSVAATTTSVAASSSSTPTSRPQPLSRPVPCPKCKAYVPTTDMAALKFHIIGHYSSVWLDRLEKDRSLGSESTDHTCGQCRKRITGRGRREGTPVLGTRGAKQFTPRGLRNALLVHWALQHDELMQQMREDPDISQELFDTLKKPGTPGKAAGYANNASSPFVTPSSTNGQSSVKAAKEVKKEKKKSWLNDDMSDRSTTDEDEDDEVNEEVEVKEEEGDVLSSDSDTAKKKQKEDDDPLSLRGIKPFFNRAYNKKRNRTNVNLDSDGDDSDDWAALESKAANRVKVPRGSEGLRRSTPRRAAARTEPYKDQEDEDADDPEAMDEN